MKLLNSKSSSSPTADAKPLRARGRRRRGAIAVELGFSLPIVVLAILGMMELSRYVMVQQILTNAAREGARRAVLPETSNADVTTLVTNYLQQTSIGNTTPQIDIEDENGNDVDLETADPRTVVSLRVTVPYNEVGFGVYYFISAQTMGSQVQMRKE